MKLHFPASLALAALLCGCATAGPVADTPALDGTAWVLASIDDHPPLPDHAATLRFEGTRAGGSDGCNRFIAGWEAAGAGLSFKAGPAATLRACEPAVMAQAEAFQRALQATRSYRIEAGQLMLLGADGLILAVLRPQPSTLAGTTWRVTGYNNGRQAVVSVLPDTSLELAFSADGRVAGSAGCNAFTASFSQDGAGVSIGPAAATRRMCARPDGVMEQEGGFLKALETVATARLEGDELELRTATDALAVRATRTWAE